jgi:hypothetical protein
LGSPTGILLSLFIVQYNILGGLHIRGEDDA